MHTEEHPGFPDDSSRLQALKETAGEGSRPGSACVPEPSSEPAEPPASSSQAPSEAGSQRLAPGETRYQLTVAERAKAAASAGAPVRPHALSAIDVDLASKDKVHHRQLMTQPSVGLL